MLFAAADAPAGVRGRRTSPSLIGIQLALWALVLSGCASSSYLTVREVPRSPLDWRLNLVSSRGPEPTARTEQVLRRYDLLQQQSRNGDEVLAKLQQELAAEPTPEKVYSFAELSYVEGRKAEKANDLAKAIDRYGAAVAHAYMYLFDPRFDQYRNPYDPQFRGASNLYNVSLEAALRIVNDQGKLKPGATQVVHTAKHDYTVEIVVRGPWHSEDFDHFEFVSDYEITGLRNHNRTYGLGVPLIAVRAPHEDEDPREKYYPPGLSFAVTAFLRVLPERGETNGKQTHRCVLELYDPLVSQNIRLNDRIVPLETDLSTPLGFFLDNPAFAERRDAATLGLLDPGRTEELTGLFKLEPYDVNKIPVLMVHGLWSSPVTWMEMFNDLQSFPEIREHFQFWFYLYPTGQPFWRAALDTMGIPLLTPEVELDHIPLDGPVVAVANHPHGLVDGMILADLIGRRRTDYKILTRALLTGIDEVAASYMIPVPFPHEPDAQRKGVDVALIEKWLAQNLAYEV